MNGWIGRCLRVDLSRGEHSFEELAQEDLTDYIGGRGLGVATLSREISPETDPLSSENKLIITSGPLVGTGAVTGASCNVITKSALSNLISCAKIRGHVGAELKFAGLDMIITE